MRENRTYGSEGGEGTPFPTPIEAKVQTCTTSSVFVAVPSTGA